MWASDSSSCIVCGGKVCHHNTFAQGSAQYILSDRSECKKMLTVSRTEVKITYLKARLPPTLLWYLERQHGLHVVTLKFQFTDRRPSSLPASYLTRGPHHKLGS